MLQPCMVIKSTNAISSCSSVDPDIDALRRIFAVGCLVVIALAWLIPNHYPPWLSAWNDAAAALGIVGLLWLAAPGPRRLHAPSWPLGAAVVLSALAVLGQWLSGKLLYAGDALMVVLYLGLFVAAVLVGSWLARQPRTGNGQLLDVLAAVWLLAALLSVGIALAQWTGAVNLGIYGADLPSRARPFANLGQPNQFCTLCYFGLCSVLWLREHGRVSVWVFWLAAVVLLGGMVMSGSRTGWLQITLLVLWGLALHTRARLRSTPTQLLLIGALFVAGVLLWPVVNEALLLSAGRSLADQMHAGMRLPYWLAMLEAISREPLWGYGWLQTGAAQQRVALEHPAFGVYFDFSHNLVLDLLLWNGVLVGGLVVTLLAWWTVGRVRACRDAGATWMLAAVGGVVVHAMLEYPLAYAYFLIPVGLAMGAVETLAPAPRPRRELPRGGVLAFAAVLSAAALAVVSDYVKVEQNFRTLRFEVLRIGTDGVHTPVPELRVLTQMRALLQVAHIEPARDMPAAQIESLRMAAVRFGIQPALRRYAIALALNGHPSQAVHWLLVLRSMWGEPAYRSAKAYVVRLAEDKYPELRQVATDLK